MIAHVVFDLPLEGSFDYSIPSDLLSSLSVGMSVKVSLGFKKLTGIIVKISDLSEFDQLKPIKSLDLQYPTLDCDQMALSEQMSAYYGCSQGQALFTIARGCKDQVSSKCINKKIKSSLTLHVVPSGNYEKILLELMAETTGCVLILVPDQYGILAIEEVLKKSLPKDRYILGSRSMVFCSFKNISRIMMIEESNQSYKQEQTPMYETRDILLMRSSIENIEVDFISSVPSVEIMDQVSKGIVQIRVTPRENKIKAQLVDLNNYNNLWRGILSPAVISSLESNLVKGLNSILVFNHRGSFAVTKCIGCNLILKCARCDSAMIYSRIKKQYICRHCTYHLPGETVCPSCKIPNWKSFGVGVEQLQKALKEKFTTARIEAFERGMEEPIKGFNILIGTIALLRFKDLIKANLVVLLDIDGELNRLDIRSCFRAYSLARDFHNMATTQFLIQSRNPDHYVAQSLIKDDADIFYREDMRIRRELSLPPFGHQVMMQFRHKDHKKVETITTKFYKALCDQIPKEFKVHTFTPQVLAKKRDAFRMNILLQGENVAAMISFIKKVKQDLKLRSQVILTLNVDS